MKFIKHYYKRGLVIFGILVFIFLATEVTYTSIGAMDVVASGGRPPLEVNYTTIPQAVKDDAARTAEYICKTDGSKYEVVYNELLELYLEAEDKDIVIIFVSGGWGWNVVENAEGWNSILTGIEAELVSSGYKTLLLNYQRTDESLRAYINEGLELFRDYPNKADYLVQRIDFLNRNITQLYFILAGESTGTVISDKVANNMADNERVYSILTGPPFWHKPAENAHTLVLTENGVNPDTFSAGDFATILWSSLKAGLGISSEKEEKGDLFNSFSAPGHYYSWDYPYVREEISNFLEENFGEEQAAITG